MEGAAPGSGARVHRGQGAVRGRRGGLAGAHQKPECPGGGAVGLLIMWGLGGCGNTSAFPPNELRNHLQVWGRRGLWSICIS